MPCSGRVVRVCARSSRRTPAATGRACASDIRKPLSSGTPGRGLSHARLALHRGADGDVTDFHVIGLFDGEPDGSCDRSWRETKIAHRAPDLLTHGLVVDGGVKLSIDESRRYRRGSH